ncbi:MAG: nitrogen fixation protein NifZ [Thiotrichales bacterium]
MRPKYEYGDEVRLTRNVRNDGTFPGAPTGRLLIKRGAVGYVRDVGTFLQDQLIYSVDFLESGRRVGCREQELQPAADPWVQNRFEFRDQVTPTIKLAISGEVIAQPGDEGEIEKVIRDNPEMMMYHARFNGRTVQVPESALNFVDPEMEEA